MEKWKAEQLQAEIGLQFALGGLEDKAVNREIDSLGYKIESINEQVRESLQPTPKQRMDLRNWKERRDRLVADRDDPKKYGKRLVSDNKIMADQMSVLYRMPTVNRKAVADLQDRMNTNNAMLKTLVASGESDLAEYTYSLKKDGAIHEIKKFGPKTAPMAPTTLGPEGTYTLGKIKKAPGATKAALTKMQEQSVVQKYQDLKSAIAGTADDVAKQRIIENMVIQGRSKEDQERVKAMIGTPDDKVLKILNETKAWMEGQYKGEKFFDALVKPKGADTDPLKLKRQ
jgi:hypothetical protein